MKRAANLIAKLRREHRDLQAGVRELDSVWSKESLRFLLPWLRRASRQGAERTE